MQLNYKATSDRNKQIEWETLTREREFELAMQLTGQNLSWYDNVSLKSFHWSDSVS
jgi:hypothetical protein